MKYKLLRNLILSMVLMFCGALTVEADTTFTCDTDCHETRSDVTGYFHLNMVCSASSPATITGNMTINGVSLANPITKTCVPDPTLTFAIDDSRILRGNSTTVRWTVDKATGCTASGDSVEWTGPKSYSTGTYNQPVSPNSDRTYTLVCRNSEGVTVTKSATLEVISPLSVSLTTTGGVNTYEIGTEIRWIATPTGGLPPYTFYWFDDITGYPVIPLGVSKGIDIMYGTLGTYTGKVQVDDSFSQSDTDTRTITIEDNREPQ